MGVSLKGQPEDRRLGLRGPPEAGLDHGELHEQPGVKSNFLVFFFWRGGGGFGMLGVYVALGFTSVWGCRPS